MDRMYQKIRRGGMYLCCWCLAMACVAGCISYKIPGSTVPGQQMNPTRPPTISNIAISPNPTRAGSIVNLTVAYVDPEGDLQFGVAAVSVDGGPLSQIAFRSTYISGILTIPIPVSYYSRPADMQITIKIRDSAGNWSNALSTRLSVR